MKTPCKECGEVDIHETSCAFLRSSMRAVNIGSLRQLVLDHERAEPVPQEPHDEVHEIRLQASDAVHQGAAVESAAGEREYYDLIVRSVGFQLEHNGHASAVKRLKEMLDARVASPPAQQTEGVIDDLLTLFTRANDGRWCFNSLSKDGAKLDAIMERVAALASKAHERG